MDDLSFSGADRLRTRRSALVPILVAVIVPCAQLALHGHYLVAAAVAVLACVLVAALLPLSLRIGKRAWTTVRPEGIAFCRGTTRIRTLAWDEIAWIRQREIRAQGGSSRHLLVTLRSGRRTVLPAVSTSALAPDPEFPRKAAQVIAYWHAHTDAATRVEPAFGTKDHTFVRTGSWQSLVAIGALVGLGFLAVHTVGDVAALHRFDHARPCTARQIAASDRSCLLSEQATVGDPAVSGGAFTPTELLLTLPDVNDDGDLYTVGLGTNPGWVGQLMEGWRVRADRFPDGGILRISEEKDDDHNGADTGTGPYTLETTAAPANRLALDGAGLALLGGVAALTGAWAASLILALTWSRRVPFRWWVPGTAPALLVLSVLAVQESAVPGPVPVAWYLGIAAALAIGLASGFVLSRRSRERALAQSSGPSPGFSW